MNLLVVNPSKRYISFLKLSRTGKVMVDIRIWQGNSLSFVTGRWYVFCGLHLFRDRMYSFGSEAWPMYVTLVTSNLHSSLSMRLIFHTFVTQL